MVGASPASSFAGKLVNLTFFYEHVIVLDII